MAQVTVVFHRCIQDSQDFGSNDEHMVSRVFLTFEVNGDSYSGLYCDLKQTVGSSYECGPIEVGSLQGSKYAGPFKYNEFRDAVERYYRSCVGSSGQGIRIGAGSTAIRMRNNTFDREERVPFNWT